MKKHRTKFRKTVFSNGLTLLTERQNFKSLSIGAWVRAGTRHERPREAGISHFLEHMLFKGTQRRSALDIAKEVDRVGGDFNAFTTREFTCFHLLLLNRDLQLGLDILSDVILNSQFDAEELERERKVILQEVSMVEDSPEEMVHDLFFELIYGRHGLGRSILGSEASVRRMRRGDLIRFFRKHYSPDRVVLSVSGDVSHETVKRGLRYLIRNHWPGRAQKKASRAELGFEPAPHLKLGRWWAVKPMEQVHIVWGVEGQKYSARDWAAGNLLNTYLGSGMSSLLFQEIREKRGLAYTVYSSLTPFSDSGIFTVYAATAMHQVPLCLKLIEECMERVRNERMCEEDLISIKNNLKGNVLLASDSSESRMISIARNEIYMGEYAPAEWICREIDAVQSEDIRKVARKILKPSKTSVLLMGPRPTRNLRTRLGSPKIL